MKNLLIYLKDYKKETILAPLFKLLEATLELFVPLVIASMIDVGIYGQNISHILKMCAVLVALGAVGLAFSVTAQYFAAKAAVSFAANVRYVLFRHIEELSYTEIDTLGTSTLITRMTSDLNQVQNGVNLTLRLLLRSPFIVFGAMLMAFTIDVKAALVFVVTIPLLSVVVFGVMLSCIPLYKKVQTKLDAVTLSTRENLAGVRVIRAFCKEKEEVDKFHEKNEILTAQQKFVGKILAIMNPGTYIIINAAILYLIHTGAIQVQFGILTQGAVVALYNYMAQILEELIKLANLIINVTKTVACGNRIQDVLEVESSMPKSIGGQNHKEVLNKSDIMIEFKHVDLRYKNGKEDALSDLNFTIKRNQTIGIIGGTGSGKTSLVNLIPRFYDATGGQILVDGKDIREYDVVGLRERIGVVPQKAVLFKGTIRENMQWGNVGASDEEIWEALSMAQAKDVVLGKEGQLDYGILAGGKNLSGGQRQRLTIARALVKKPDILILDDSASALDFATDKALRSAISQLSDMTVLIVSQRTSSIMHADRILVLEDGKIEGIGTHEELLDKCQVYKEIYDSQFQKEEDAK